MSALKQAQSGAKDDERGAPSLSSAIKGNLGTIGARDAYQNSGAAPGIGEAFLGNYGTMGAREAYQSRYAGAQTPASSPTPKEGLRSEVRVTLDPNNPRTPPAMPAQVPDIAMPRVQPPPAMPSPAAPSQPYRELPLDSLENFPNRGQPVGTTPSVGTLYNLSAPTTQRYVSPNNAPNPPIGTINGMTNAQAAGRIQGARVPMNLSQDNRPGARLRLQPQVMKLENELGAVNEIINNLAVNGETLTAAGLRAYVQRAGQLNSALSSIYNNSEAMYGDDVGSYTDLEQQRLANQGRLDATDLAGQYDYARQGLANEGALDRQSLANKGSLASTMAAGNYDLQEEWMSGRGELNRQKADALWQGMNQQAFAEPVYDSDPIEQTQKYLREVRWNRGVDSWVSNAGGNVGLAFRQLSSALAEKGIEDPTMIPDSLARRLAKPPTPEDGELADLLGTYQKFAQRLARGAQVPISPVRGFAEGGLVGALPQQSLGAMQNYQQYVAAARQMGLSPVPFEQFATMAANTQPAATQPGMPQMQPNAQASAKVFGMAEGGVVPEGGALAQVMGPQVDGAIVMDPDPNAPTDSIPAMIDGQQPAALDSGEFVLPKDVVMYYGTEKLQKLIEKARGGGKPAGGQQPQGQSQGAQYA